MIEPTPAHVTLRRAARAAGDRSAGGRVPAGWLRAALGVPLMLKLVGANLLIALLAGGAMSLTSTGGSRADLLILAGALLVGLAVNCLLVRFALLPVWELERTAARVWRGDLAARVPASGLADASMARLGRTMNLLLDSLATDRERMRALAAQTIRAQEDERSRIARELHDSTAQQIAALTYQLAAAARDSAEPELAARLSELRELAGEVLEEVRSISHTIHPRVLEDLGLVPALEWLTRQTRERGTLAVEFDTALSVGDETRIDDTAAAALYRVAQESLRNVERHAGAHHATLSLRRESGHALLDVVDDGHGFDLAEAMARRPGMGLFSMRERLALVGGSLDVTTEPGRGTHVRARVPLDGRATPTLSSLTPISEQRS